jgi:menaquinone-dependent protoporphyrinogen IX oxidase
MRGAIFYSSKYGSTAQYANWIAESTGLPVFDTDDSRGDPSLYDFLVIGSPILYYKVFKPKWFERNLAAVANKPLVFFTVSGAPGGPKLDKWISDCLPAEFVSQANHVALRGRQKPEELSFWDGLMLKIAASQNKDPEARKEEFEGFDFVDKSSIAPIVEMVRQIQSGEALES